MCSTCGRPERLLDVRRRAEERSGEDGDWRRRDRRRVGQRPPGQAGRGRPHLRQRCGGRGDERADPGPCLDEVLVVSREV